MEQTAGTTEGCPHRFFGSLLLYSESERLLHGQCQFGFQRTSVRVRRQVDTVEAGVTLGQLRDLACLFDREAARTIGALQVLEAVDRDTGGAGGKLQKTRLALRRPRLDGRPEPLHHLVLLGEATVVGEPLPVVTVRNK